MSYLSLHTQQLASRAPGTSRKGTAKTNDQKKPTALRTWRQPTPPRNQRPATTTGRATQRTPCTPPRPSTPRSAERSHQRRRSRLAPVQARLTRQRIRAHPLPRERAGRSHTRNRRRLRALSRQWRRANNLRHVLGQARLELLLRETQPLNIAGVPPIIEPSPGPRHLLARTLRKRILHHSLHPSATRPRPPDHIHPRPPTIRDPHLEALSHRREHTGCTDMCTDNVL